MNMLKDFEMVDPESEFHWKKKADLAFRSKNESGRSDILIIEIGSLMLIPTDLSAKKNLDG